ncbi:hypothetical protein BJ170DRAFT_149255 [Xylariales sp. AK1849]|nr:hypothetical protein BJ170DRAFT_149255 [Xylariales sp. AK1849]
MPIVINVMYPQAAASGWNMEYYLNQHMPLVEKHWGPQGLKSWTITTFGKDSPHYLQAILLWESAESFAKAAHKDEVMGDIKNFTTEQPALWVGDVVGQGLGASGNGL